MTDKTDALVALADRLANEADTALRGKAAHLARQTAREIRDALAAPAEGGQGEAWIVTRDGPEWSEIHGVYAIEANAERGADKLELRRKGSKDVIDSLSGYSARRHKVIDSAGGAKCGVPVGYTTDADGSIVPGSAYDDDERNTPQLAGGDGAVAPSTDWPAVIEGEDGHEYVPRRVAEQRVWGALKFSEANRPAATAAVPAIDEAMRDAGFDAFRFHRSHGAAEREAIYAALTAALAAAPAAPKGGVVDAKTQGALLALAQDIEDWARSASWPLPDPWASQIRALANQEQRHDALADGEAASA